MATHGFAGLFVKLKDRSVPLDDRLKLLRFSWKSQDVFIPNKEQALIDLLGTYLLDQKTDKLIPDDASKVWQCLHEVLHTRRVQAARGQGRELVVKQSLAQLMTTYLANEDGKGKQPSMRSLVVGCCQAVVTSPMLAHVFTDRLDIMLSVICSLVKMGGEADSDDTQLLLSTLVDKFLKALRTAPNQNKVLQTMCDQLVPALVPLWSESPSASVETAGQVFLAAFTHRDHRHGLNLFLESDPASPDEKLKKRGKMASHVFSTFDKTLDTQNAEKMVHFLCEVFNSYIRHNCHEGSHQNSFNMLVHLCHLIGWRRDSAALCRTTVAPPAGLRGVKRLLTVVHDQELYSVGADDGAKQLGFYRHLVKVMLNIDSVCPDWFSILTLLLRLNHQIVEPSLTEILTAGWIGGGKQMSSECVSSLDIFLEKLVSTYSKLRQVPKLVDKLLQCLCSSNHGDRPVPMTTRFFKSFGDTTQSLPQGTMVDIWKSFLARMKESFIAEDAQKANTGHLQGVVCLLHQFLLSVRVVDYTVTEATYRAVQDLVVAMETDILTPLLHAQLDKEEVQGNLLDTLHLCYSWGEVVALLAQYRQYRASQLQACTVVSHSHDLSFIHSYFNADQWKSVHKKVSKANSAALQYVWDLLLVQKARTTLLLKEARDWPVATEMLKVMLVFPEQLEETTATATWSKSVWEVTRQNAVVARWHLVTTYLGAMQCVLTQEQLGSIAAWVARTHRSEAQTQTEGGVTLAQVTRDFLSSPWVKENSGLQAQLITQLLSTCRECVSSNVNKPKKRKSSSGAMLVQKLYNILTSQDIDWAQAAHSAMEEGLQEAGRCLGAVLADTEAWTSLPGLATLTSCLQVLDSLPLEEMGSCDQVRCLTGLLALLAVLSRCSNQSKEEVTARLSVSERCVALCTVLLESCSPAQLFRVIDIEVYLSWLCLLPAKQPQQIDNSDDSGLHKHVLLTRVSCESIMRLKDVDKLDKLAPWITQTFRNLASSSQTEMEGKLVLMSSLLQSVAKVLTRAYLRDHLRPSCTAIYTSLSEILLQLSPLFADTSPPRCDVGDHRVALLVYCYSSVVEMYFGQDDIKAAFMEKFPQMLAWCEKVLTQTKSSASLFEKMSALNFLYSISKFHTGLDSVYTQAARLDTWLLLVQVLQNMLVDQSQTDSQLQQHNSQSQTSSQLKQLNSQSASKPGLNHSNKSEIDQSKLVEDSVVHKSNKENDSKSESDMKDKITRIHTLLQSQTGLQEKEKGLKLRQNLTSQTKDKNGDTDEHEGVLAYSAVVQWYGCLVFEGRLGTEEGRLLMSLTQTVMAALLACLEVEQFERIVSRLVDNVHSSNLLTDTTVMRSSLYTWRQLLQLEFSKEQTNILKKSAKQMMLNLQSILQQLHHRDDEAVVMEIVVPVLHTQQQILAQKLLRSQLYLLCLHSCAYAPLGGATYFPMFHAVCHMLDTLLVHHENTVFQSIPAYVACAKRLLLSVVDQSDQERVSHDPDVVESLKGCAYQMERLFTLMASHKVEFGKVATYVVADYVSAVQQVTLVPVVKRALVPAVYQMLDLCDTHAVAQLHTVLSHGVIDIFKALYREYTKFHKYTGKV